jgi:hydroxymethylpyrimidine/phosphomethylpyrimidine kinase
MVEAIRHAKEYVTEAIRHGAEIAIGHGHGPVNHGFNPQTMYIYESK